MTFAEEENRSGPVLAVRYLTYLITHPVCRAAILSHHVQELQDIQQQLKQSMVSVQGCTKSCTGITAAVKIVYGVCTGVY